MRSLRTLRSLDLAGRRALVRADFNVPLDGGAIADDGRIRAALPTLRHALEKGCACVVMSHLGRPKGRRVEALRFDPVAERLAALLPRYCHRKHASMVAVPQRFAPEARAAGRLVEREVEALDRVPGEPERPFVAVFGGAKVSDKLKAVRALVDRVGRILIGGAMSAGEVPDGAFGLDIGPRTIDRYREEILGARTLLWNGPMGRIEDDRFCDGTRAVDEAIARSDAASVVGGGETSQLVRRLDLAEQVTHLSTGGDAFLDYIANGTLPALEILGE